jgi:hypothetical protein
MMNLSLHAAVDRRASAKGADMGHNRDKEKKGKKKKAQHDLKEKRKLKKEKKQPQSSTPLTRHSS